MGRGLTWDGIWDVEMGPVKWTPPHVGIVWQFVLAFGWLGVPPFSGTILHH